MKGSMRQRGSAWELRVYLGADPVSGKQRYATKTVRAGKREAQRLLNEMKVEVERGLATRTTATVGARPVARARPRGLPAHPRDPASGARPGCAVGLARRQPGRGGVTAKGAAAGDRPPTPAQLARLQKAIDASDPEFGVFVRVSAMTGARRSEMLALRWPDVDLERGVVTIGRGLVQGPDGRLVEKDTKTHQEGEQMRQDLGVRRADLRSCHMSGMIMAWPELGSARPLTPTCSQTLDEPEQARLTPN